MYSVRVGDIMLQIIETDDLINRPTVFASVQVVRLRFDQCKFGPNESEDRYSAHLSSYSAQAQAAKISVEESVFQKKIRSKVYKPMYTEFIKGCILSPFLSMWIGPQTLT